MILSLTIGVIVFSIIFNFLVLPVLNKNDALNKEINIARAKLKKYLQLLSQKEDIQSKYSNFSTRFKISGQPEEIAVSTLSELEGLAKEANIRIIDIRPQGASKASALYKETLIDLKTEGAAEGYLKFIYDIENSLLLLRIKRYQLSAKPNAPLLEGSFSISQVSLE